MPRLDDQSFMKLIAYKKYFIETLTPIYDAVEAESFFNLLLEHTKQLSRINLALNPEIALSQIELDDWNSILEKLVQEIPIQYILGKTSFCGLDFEVNQNVLIPRPETEELVDWIVSNSRTVEQSNNRILDIGTGSGCIAITLAKSLPCSEVYAIDISEPALATAKVNAENNDVKINFIKADILTTENLNLKFDIIVSNPPYVRYLEKTEIKKNVLEHEPHLALFVNDDDPLIFYRKIVQLANHILNPKGQLYFEVNQYLAKDVVDLLEAADFQSVELKKDIYGNDRMVYSKK